MDYSGVVYALVVLVITLLHLARLIAQFPEARIELSKRRQTQLQSRFSAN